ncbi:fasciclin domain-containing protein [Candidatus Roizmanbacteria bacterium]|nr:fasciclin domain-containing protein [Candidatus Roizmanbacteria bacterium]
MCINIIFSFIIAALLVVGAGLLIANIGGSYSLKSRIGPASLPSIAVPSIVSSETKNIVEIASSTPSLHIFTQGMRVSGFSDTLSYDGPYTVFAPVDQAFSILPSGVLDKLLGNKVELLALLMYHVVSGVITVEQIPETPTKLMTVEGKELIVQRKGSQLFVNDALVLVPNIQASNGVVHIIDTILLPPQ